MARAESMPAAVALVYHRANVEHLEEACSQGDWTKPDPHRVAAMRARARAIVAELDYLDESAHAGDVELTDEQRGTLDQIRDRADELVDTLAWGAEAHQELGALAEAETGG
jgi:hypothetical protein